MPQDQLREAVEALRTRVQLELDAQLGTLAEQQSAAIEATRRAAEADAEQHWAAKVELVRAEWTARLQAEVVAARSEAERRMVAEALRLRLEAEQAAAEAAARAREEFELALAEERQRAATEVEAERDAAARVLATEREQAHAAAEREREQLQRAVEHEREQSEQLQRAIEHEREQLQSAAEREREQLQRTAERERDQLQRAVDHERDQARALTEKARQAQVVALEKARAAQRQSQLETVQRILGAVHAMSTAGSLSDTLTALLSAASAEAPRAALLLVNGSALQGWKSSGFTGPSPSSVRLSVDECPLFAEALRSGEPAAVEDGDASAAPAFAALAFHAEAVALPIVLGGETVAMLYADSGEDAGRDVPATWRETLQILSRHASACLAHLTAVRTAQALRSGRARTSAAVFPGGESSEDDEHGARRYARLLVSEIKLYNEPAVNIGRQNRDLLQRLRPEIERARRLYEERVPSALHARGSYFQQELVQTLADGDTALLGGEA